MTFQQCGEEDASAGREAAGTMAAAECASEHAARKRKERRESGGAHERKERRPHTPAEEEPLHECNRAQPAPAPAHSAPTAARLEAERRHERLSRARRPNAKRRRPARHGGPRVAPGSAKENERHGARRTPSPPPHGERAPVRTEPWHAGATTPVRDENAAGTALDATPFVIFGPDDYARGGDDALDRPSLRREAPEPVPLIPDTDKRLEKITKKGPKNKLETNNNWVMALKILKGRQTQRGTYKKNVHNLKKKILKYESEMESTTGCSVSQLDRMRDLQLHRMYEDLHRLKLEKKCIQSDPAEYAMKLLAARAEKESEEKLELALKSDKPMAEIVEDIEQWLSECRSSAGRPGSPTRCGRAQLQAEKWCVQRALLRLEAARGRPPAASAERGAARPLYDRYRRVKRLLAAVCARDTASGALNNGELATILEHEALLFTTASIDSSSDSQERHSDATSDQDTNKSAENSSTSPRAEVEEAQLSSSSAKSTTSEDPPESFQFQQSNEALHCLPHHELARLLTETKIQKSALRRSIKEYEIDFEEQNSRKIQKDDRQSKEVDYANYKAIKARIRLLTALMNKHKQSDE